jgi:membrane fusion protein, heavy metal efflux system
MNSIKLRLLRTTTLLSVCFYAYLVSAAALTFAAGEHHDAAPEEHQDLRKGPHNGRLLVDEDFEVELAIFERGVPPEYRAWARWQGQAIQPQDWQLEVELSRLGGQQDKFAFAAEGDFLRSPSEVTEPHSFDVKVIARYKNQDYEWQFPSHEGRLSLTPAIASAAGVTTAIAGPGRLQERIKVYGAINVDPQRISHIQARYPGVLRAVNVSIGSRVKAGETLASVESNESLRSYPLLAPIAGVIIARHANPGEFSGERILFTLADYSQLELDLQIFPQDISKLKPGLSVAVTDGQRSAVTRIEYLTPHDEGAATLVAHASLDNSAGLWVPNQRVSALLSVADFAVPLRVDKRALQAFRDWQVVFIKVGDSYEIRPLELGRSDDNFIEVLSGLQVGDSYVVQNSYLLKADLEKSGASHDH